MSRQLFTLFFFYNGACFEIMCRLALFLYACFQRHSTLLVRQRIRSVYTLARETKHVLVASAARTRAVVSVEECMVPPVQPKAPQGVYDPISYTMKVTNEVAGRFPRFVSVTEKPRGSSRIKTMKNRDCTVA